MTVVVDASVAVRWLFKLPGYERAQAVFDLKERLIAPDLIAAEIANAAWKLVRYEAFDERSAAEAVEQAGRFIDEIVPCMKLKDRALSIALDLRHPAYDCFYLALARQYDTRVITADDRLARHCANGRYANLIQML